MNKPTIVVPLDGSHFAEAAVPTAIKMAEQLGTALTLVSAYDDEPLVAGYPLNTADLRASLVKYLDKVATKIQAVTKVPVDTSAVSGSITKTLIEFVQRTQPAMVVLSTHGRGPISRFWLGSVADRMLRYVKMPVLLVRPPDTMEVSDVDFGADVAFKKVLIPLDGSDRAEEALAWARKVAAQDAEYIALRGVSIPSIASPYLPHTIQENEHVLAHDRDDADRYLEGVVKRFNKDGLALRPVVQTSHNAASAIMSAVDDYDVDLTVITTHGRSGLARALLGSVADKVIRASAGPVLVVRTVHTAREFDESFADEATTADMA